MENFKISEAGKKTLFFETHQAAKNHEAFLIGLSRSYTLTYPDGREKQIVMSKKPLENEELLKNKIEALKKQMKDALRSHSTVMGYYKKKLVKLEEQLKDLENTDTNQSQPIK